MKTLVTLDSMQHMEKHRLPEGHSGPWCLKFSLTDQKAIQNPENLLSVNAPYFYQDMSNPDLAY